MLTHLPGRMSQPSRKGVTSNILILRCSFHKTAKRLSITSLMHPLRLHAKIQSSIVRHDKNVRPSYTCDFATNKTEKKYEVSQNTELSKLTTKFPPFSQTATQKSRIGLLHRNQFAEGIQLTWTIISQIYRKKKICQKALTIQISIAYLCDTTMKGWSCLFQNATQLYTRCT